MARRSPAREAFRDARYLPAEGYLQFAIEDYPVRLVALDTLVSGKHGGMLCAERLGWLDTALAAQLDLAYVLQAAVQKSLLEAALPGSV